MRASTLMLLALGLAACNPSAPPAAKDANMNARGDVDGLWWVTTPGMALRPEDGSELPLSEEGKASYAHNKELLVKAGPPTKEDLSACLPLGLPRILTAPYPFRIVAKNDTPEGKANVDFVAFVFEHNHTFRLAYMNEEPKGPDEVLSAFMGTAAGHWQNGDLIVQAQNFRDGTMLDSTGVPHSESLKLTEHYKRAGDDRLEAEITIDDPVMFTKPWSVRLNFEQRPGEELEEYACGVGDWRTRYGTGDPS